MALTKHNSLHSYFAISHRVAGSRNRFSPPLWRSQPAVVSVFTTAQSPNEGVSLWIRGERSCEDRRKEGWGAKPKCIQTDLSWGRKEKWGLDVGGSGGSLGIPLLTPLALAWSHYNDKSKQAIKQSGLTSLGWTGAGWGSVRHNGSGFWR